MPCKVDESISDIYVLGRESTKRKEDLEIIL